MRREKGRSGSRAGVKSTCAASATSACAGAGAGADGRGRAAGAAGASGRTRGRRGRGKGRRRREGEGEGAQERAGERREDEGEAAWVQYSPAACREHRLARGGGPAPGIVWTGVRGWSLRPRWSMRDQSCGCCRCATACGGRMASLEYAPSPSVNPRARAPLQPRSPEERPDKHPPSAPPAI